MKAALGWLLCVGVLQCVAACSDSRSRDTTRAEKQEHPAGHLPSAGGSNVHAGHEGTRHEPGSPMDSSLAWVAAAANKVVISDQSSVPARITDTTITVRAYGRVAWDVRRNRKITTRTGGRVERLYVRYPYQYVRKGQKILELYSPEVATYAAEYLHHLQTPGDEELRVLTKKKLALLGVTPQQIRQLENTGNLPPCFAVYSPYEGYALEESGGRKMTPAMRQELMPAGGAMGDGMNGGTNPVETAFEGAVSDLPLREGMYVNRGQTLFYVNDFAVIWGVLSFEEHIQPLLKRSMNVVIKSELLELPIRSTLAFIEPAFDGTGQKFVQARVYLPNTGGRFKINSLIEGRVDVPLNQKLIIPAASVFSLGTRKVVWVKTGTTAGGKNIFTPRAIQTSLMDHQIAVVAGGLSPLEEVAADAGYLLDNQSLVEQ